MNYISAMELTTLLNKTKVSVSNLTIYEHRFLSFLLARVHGKSVPIAGYLAWPGVDEIYDYTKISSTQIARIRKTMLESGWFQYIPGKGPGNSNHYYINAQKIIDCAVQSGENAPSKPAAPTVLQDKPKKEHKRNTDNLKQNQDKPPQYQKPVVQPKEIVVDKPATVDAFDDSDMPDWAKEPVKTKVVPPTNPDGSPRFMCNVRVYSKEEYDKEKEKKRIADMNKSEDIPF